jgi:hypothetical protein
MPSNQGIYGRVLLKNQRPVTQDGTYGRVWFTDTLELFRHPSIYGRVKFVDIRAFPPYEDGLPVPPSYALSEIPAFNNSVVEFGRHTEQRLAHDDGVRWGFKLRFDVLSPAYKNRLLAFFLARKGSHQPFTLVHPLTLEYYTVRFVQSAAEFELFSYRLYNFGEIELIEINEIFY